MLDTKAKLRGRYAKLESSDPALHSFINAAGLHYL